MNAEPTILIVEDDPAIRHVLREALTDEGYDVIEAVNGREALNTLASSHPDAPCAIVLDLMMPVMDGWEFRAEQQHRQLALQTPIIVLSASRRAIPAAAELSASMVMPKPFDLSELLDAVATATTGSA